MQILPELWEDPGPGTRDPGLGIGLVMRLIEQCVGVGQLGRQGDQIRQVRYSIARYQGMQPGNGLPIPGLHRIEGTIDFEPEGAGNRDSGLGTRESRDEFSSLVGQPLTLRLEDGRTIGITLADAAGRVLSEGHGPSRCLCC